MLKIRFARRGCKKRPFYQLVVADSRRSRDGLFIEALGFYNPLADLESPDGCRINFPRVAYWQSVGAQLSDRARQLLHRMEAKQRVLAD